MWSKLPRDQREKYRTLITNFASLSEAFAQKAYTDEKIAPIINSKFQETAFQRSFNAQVEDISNSSYDASIISENGAKYLVGIKSFGIGSGDQKVAQFKSNSVEWTSFFEQMRKNAEGKNSKEEIDEVNRFLYSKIAHIVSDLRNKRIRSSEAQIKGFDIEGGTENVYHVLMPSKKGDDPKIYVGEISYNEIDVDNIEILGTTGIRNPENFMFYDGKHKYKYTASDSQLYMSFENKDIVVDTWNVDYIEDAFYVFENINNICDRKNSEKSLENYEWKINVKSFSGFNEFYGITKMAKKDGCREKEIKHIKDKYVDMIDESVLNSIEDKLKKILLDDCKNKADKHERIETREKLMLEVCDVGIEELTKDISKLVYRPVDEFYIPIPNARKFHSEHPDFFGKNIGTFKGKKGKLALPKEKRRFTLRILPSGDEIECYINQGSGKAIQSYGRIGILGEWILRNVFQLKEREPLTQHRLEELGISKIRLSKIAEGVIGLEFI